MKTLFLHWHLGLGDSILCNGLVRVLATRVDKLILPAKLEKVVSVAWQFSDLENVFVQPVKDDNEASALARTQPSLGLGCWSKAGMRTLQEWDRQFYSDADVPFEARWSEFKVPPTPSVKIPAYDYAFVHHEPSRGMKITRPITLPVVEPPKPPHIFWNISLLQGAAEIHVVNSCFLCLSDHLELKAKRFLHNYARTSIGPPVIKHDWTIL